MSKNKKKSMAAVQLLQDRDSVVNIDFDHICEFVGDIHEQFDYWERLAHRSHATHLFENKHHLYAFYLIWSVLFKLTKPTIILFHSMTITSWIL